MNKRILAAVGGALLAAGLGANAQVVVRIDPPAPVVETRPNPPHDGWIWQPGYHRWDGEHYVWVPGTYVAPPYEHAEWVAGHWDHHDGGGWVWVDGHWRH